MDYGDLDDSNTARPFLTYWLFVALFLVASFTNAQTIDDIQVRGNRKIERDAILSRIQTVEGQDLDRKQIRDDIQAIFSMNYFYDVKVDLVTVNGKKILVYTVVERPAIGEIVYKGNNELDDDEMADIAKIKTYEILNMKKIRKGVDEMLKQYEDKGFFLARVNARVEDIVKGESVRLIYDVVENDKVEVKKISFLGNQKMNDQKLKGSMMTQEGGFFSFLSGSGSYKQEAFDVDVQRLKFLYFNEGYVQVKFDRPQVYVTPDKKSIYITIRIEEGDQFNVGQIDFSGDLLFSIEDLKNTTLIDDSDIFSWQKMQQDLSALQAKYGDLGYAFANIIPKTRINEADRIVDVTFEIDKGEKVYFGEINVIGNSKTRDKVLRRELRIYEGELYNETRRRESLENIQRLGFFDEVNFKTSTPPDRPNIMNVDIVVKERNTGSIQLGAGYGTTSGAQFTGQVNQINFLGRGQSLSASVQADQFAQLYNFNFTEPYFNDTLWSVGFDLYRSRRNRFIYFSQRSGGAVRFGHPIGGSDYLRAFVRYRLDGRDLGFIVSEDRQDRDIFPLETSEGITSSVRVSLDYDKRNDRFAPSKGAFARASLEYAGLGGDLKYTSGNFIFRWFRKAFWEVVFRSNFTYSFIQSNDPDRGVPFDERFLLGGAYNLRGYRINSVGRRQFSQVEFENLTDSISDPDRREELARVFVGGTQQALVSLELEFPLIEEAGIKGVTFYDAGVAHEAIVDEFIYSDVGFGFRWFSPIGPLRFEWGFPMRRIKEIHDPVNFEFSIGAPF